MSQFTNQMVMNLRNWETLPYDSFRLIRTYLLAPFHPLPATDDAAWRTDCSGEYAYAARLPAQFSPRSCAGDEKGQRLSRDALRTQLDSAGYRHVDQVMEHGEYATRGALLRSLPIGE